MSFIMHGDMGYDFESGFYWFTKILAPFDSHTNNLVEFILIEAYKFQ